MEMLLDLGIVLFIPLMVFRGYRKGAILMLCSFFAIFVAFFGATFLANNLYQPVGRLVQPVVQHFITQVLEEALGGENILINPPEEVSGMDNPFTLEEEESEGQYVTLERALYVVQQAVELEQIQGFLQQASDLIEENKDELVGSATEVISTVVGYEIARQIIFIVSFVLSMAVWTLFSRVLNGVANLPGLAEVNGVIGGGFGLLSSGLLVFVVAWCTRGGIIPWDSVDKTVLFQFFAYHSPLDLIAGFSQVKLDL